MDTTNSKQNERITYENEYDKHIADLKIKIIYKYLVDAVVLDVGCGETETVYRRVGRVMKKYIGIDSIGFLMIWRIMSILRTYVIMIILE